MGGGKRRVENGRVIRRDPEEKMTLSQIMLRFRPIAPRPVAAVAVESSICTVPVKERRVKRKYVRIKKKMAEACNLRNLEMLEVNSSTGEFVVTDPVRKVPEWISFDVSGSGSSRINRIVGKLITPAPPSAGLHDVDLAVRMKRSDQFVESWITMESVSGTCVGKLITPAPPSTAGLHDGDLAVTMKQSEFVESWITMESVTETCEDESLLGNSTDDEIRKDLETDSCPGFISDGYDRVQWVNQAYRRMVDPNRAGGGAPPPEVVVWLGVKLEKSAFEYRPAFSCKVRVVFRLSEKKMQVMTVPCDVWKMDSGGYAWRLDVKAALSLGRFN